MSELIVLYGAWGLFLAAFAAATVLPFSSEVLVVAYIASGGEPWMALLAASAGNTLGGMTSYLLGYFMELKRVIKFLKICSSLGIYDWFFGICSCDRRCGNGGTRLFKM